MTFETTPLSPRIGTRVHLKKKALVAGLHASELQRLLKERGVLVFPRVDLTDAEHLAVSRSIGKVIPFCGTGVRPIRRDGAHGDALIPSFYWHFDGAFDDIPSSAGLLAARALSSSGGGQTSFANTVAAYDDLSDTEKATYDKLRVVHSFEANQRIADPVPSYATLLEWHRRFPNPRRHPMVWNHGDGRKSLAVGTTSSHVEGMELDEGRLLLAKVLDWVIQSQYVYRHDWRVGDLVVYDNTSVLHRVEPYARDSGRLMHRTSLAGNESFF